jgi:hypothetical protein
VKTHTIAEVKDGDTVVTPALKEITPFTLDRNDHRPMPMVQFGMHVKARYPFAGADDSPYESVRPWERWLPFPTVGFAMTDPADNYFLGAGINLSRGVVAVAGAHFGKVKRLLAGYDDGKAFTIPATDNFAIDDIVDEGTRRGFFFAITIDSSTVGKLFSAVGSGDEAGGGTKKGGH